MKAYEVTDGFDELFVETMEDVELVIVEWSQRLNTIGQNPKVTFKEVEIIDIPENERRYMDELRQRYNR